MFSGETFSARFLRPCGNKHFVAGSADDRRQVSHVASNHDPFHLIERHLVVAPVVEAGGAC